MSGSSCVKNEDGIIVTDSDGVKEVCRICMEKLRNVEYVWDGDVECDLIEGPSCRMSEVVKALKHSKTGKA